MDIREKIKGMFLGVAIGDALGMPVETFAADRIASEYGRITDYLAPSGHKWFDGEQAGTWTDDTQLTLAVAEGVIEAGCLDMDIQAKQHVDTFNKYGTKGWGRTTRSAVRELVNGASWGTSAHSPEPGQGLGNGVCMKITPLAPLFYKYITNNDETSFQKLMDSIKDFCYMTHKSPVALVSGHFQLASTFFCLINDPKTFSVTDLKDGLAVVMDRVLADCLDTNSVFTMIDFATKMNSVGHLSTNEAIAQFGGGSCYCVDSICFTYNFFLKNYMSIDSLYDVVSAGGDTDSNGSMLGALLGALNGPSIFPDELVENLDKKDIIIETASRLCDALKL